MKMKKEIDFKHLESEILEMEKNVVTNKELKFAFHNQLIKIIFQTKMTQNLKKSGITKETSD